MNYIDLQLFNLNMVLTQKTSFNILVVLLFVPFFAISAKYRFGYITIKEGLSQSTVKSIYQDYQGYIWFGTADGLNKYDGYKISVYRNNPLQSKSLTDNDISCIYENPADSLLWIGTQSEGLNLYDRKHDRFITFRKDAYNKNALPGNEINCMIADNTGRLWIGTSDGSLCYKSSSDSGFVQHLFPNQNFRSVYRMANNRDGRIWLGTEKGLYLFDPVVSTIVQVYPVPGFSGLVKSLVYDIKGTLWIGTQGAGLIKYQHESGKTEYFLTPEHQINAIIQRKDGTVWAATQNGLYIYAPFQNIFSPILSEPDDTESMNDEVIFSIYEDCFGILWVGTLLGGVNKLEPENSRFRKYNNFNKNRVNLYAENNIKGMYSDAENTLWVATSKGLFSLNADYIKNDGFPGRIEIYFDGTDQDFVFGDKSGNIYASNNKGVFVLKKGKSQFQQFNFSGVEKPERFNKLNCGIENAEGIIWFLTQNGLLQFDPLKNTFDIKKPNSANAGSTNFLSGTESHDGNLWLGSSLGELFVFEPNKNQFTKKIPAGDFNRIFSVCENEPGEIWIGTNNGLFLYNARDGKLKRYHTSDGLSNNVVYSVYHDRKGKIWCSTNVGISVFDSKSNQFTNYTWENGLQSNEFNQNASCKASNGILYFGGIEGFNLIDPESLTPNPFVPNVLISQLIVNHIVVTTETHPEISEYQVSEAKAITLKNSQTNFTLEFTALNFILPNKNHYRYKLDGYEEKWVEAENRRTASYTNLDPGTYTFMVQGSNNDNIWNPQPTTLRIVILPPFYLTWWFKMIVFVCVVLVVYLVFYFRLSGIKHERALLEELVAEKTAALSEKNLRIEQQNKELVHINEEIIRRNENIRIKNYQLEEQNKQIVKQRDNLLALAEQVQGANQAKINFFTTISHEFRTPLTLIIGPLKELILHFDDVSKAELQRKFKIIYGNASKLLLLVNELLDFRKADTEKAGLNLTHIDLVLFIQQTAWLFNDIAQRKKITFRFESTHKKIECQVDTEKIEKIVFNLISNAFKFTPDHGQITIGLDKISTNDETSVIIKVTDSGIGIPDEAVNKIFDIFYQADHTQYLQQSGSGLGLALVKKYTELHGGIVEVKSKLGAGTTFMLKLPVITEENKTNEAIGNDLPLPVANELLIASIDEYSPVLANDLKTGKEHTQPRLLLIENDNNLRAYLKEILTPDYRIDEAANAKTGLQLADSRHPDLIICDVILPDQSGFELCRKIKDEFNTCHIPVILLTALTDLPNQITGLKSGADAYITKPFDLQHLYLTIKNLITQRKRIQHKYYHGNSIESREVSNKPADQQFLDRIIAEIEKNLTDYSFDVEKLCENIRLSQPQTYRKIKALTDLSITEFIRNIRLRKAAELMATGNKSISEVAYEVGFSDPNYFSKCFVKVYGQTPSEFLKLKR